MRLGKRLVVSHTALIVALLVDALVVLCGFLSMRADIHLLMYEHQELTLINQLSVRVAEVAGALRDDVPDQEFLVTALDKAMADAENLRELQEAEEGRDPEHAGREQSLIDKVINGLADIRLRAQNRFVDRPDNDHLSITSQAAETLENLEGLAAETRVAATAAREDASSNIAWTLTVTLGNCVVVIVCAVLLGVAHYHIVMRPLRRLNDGVRRVSNGQFDHVLPTEGAGEFADLARDFNRMAAELHALYANLEKKVAQKSRELVRSERLASVGFLAAGVAHEINNPLGIISTFAELSIRNLTPLSANPSIAEVAGWLRLVHEEAFRCKGIIEKLLSLSKKGDDSRGPVSIAQVARDVATMVIRLGKYKNRDVILELDALDGVVVTGNESEIKQVLLNLVVNALEAVDDGGEVRIEGKTVDDLVALRVLDDGCGMSPETIDHVFEPFFSSKQGHSEHGVGLGLSICHAIIENHRGRITAESEGLGKGSRFTIELPRNLHSLN